MARRWTNRYRAVEMDGIAASYDVVVVGAGPAGIMRPSKAPALREASCLWRRPPFRARKAAEAC